MKPIIHIGYSKTATTWFRNKFYPHVQNANLIKRNSINENIVRTELINFEKQDVLNKLNIPNDSKQLILCSETLIGHISIAINNEKYATENAIKLKELFGNPNIVIFIRNHQEIITSAYIQYIKNGGNFSINKFLYSDEDLFTFKHLEFDKKIEHYIDVMGKDNVHVFLYEDFLNNKHQFLNEFVQRFSLDVDFEKIDLNELNSRINNLFLKRIANCFTKPNKNMKFKVRFFHIPFLSGFVDLYIRKTKNTFLSGKEASSENVLGEKNISFIKNYYSSTNQNLCKFIDKEKLILYKYL